MRPTQLRIALHLAATLAFLPSILAAQNTSPSTQQIDALFSAYHSTTTPGCAVGIEAPGQPTFTAAYGMADLEHAIPNTPDTVFEAGSVSKQFTAAALLLLVERGKLSLEDDIRQYFPELPAYDKPITVRMLLNHTSGLRDWGSVEDIAGWPRSTRVYTHAIVLDILSRQHALNYTPGEYWSYTNSGYNLAVMLVEKLSGETLQSFMQREFFQPLGMTSTQWRDNFRRVVPHRAVAYEPDGKTWQQLMPFENIYGNGGLLTTVGDLLKWNRNLTSGALHAEIFSQMQKASTLSDGHTVNYGLGLFLETFNGLAEIDHSGATAGYRAWLGRIPAKGLSVAMLCNASTATLDPVNQILRLYLGGEKPGPITPPAGFASGSYRSLRDGFTSTFAVAGGKLTMNGYPVYAKVRQADGKLYLSNSTYGEDAYEHVDAWSPKDQKEFTGEYASSEADAVLHITLETGVLTVHGIPGQTSQMTPIYADTFVSDLGVLHFLRDPSGKVHQLDLSNARLWKMSFPRASTQMNAAK